MLKDAEHTKPVLFCFFYSNIWFIGNAYKNVLLHYRNRFVAHKNKTYPSSKYKNTFKNSTVSLAGKHAVVISDTTFPKHNMK